MPHNIYIKYKIRIKCIGVRAYTNNLPLALVPIGHSPKTEGPNMTLMFSTISRMRWNVLSMCLDLWCDRGSLGCAMAPLLS